MGNLGNLLHEIKRLSDAEHWWRRAAEAGNPDAMYNLAILLDKSMRFDDAITWYRRAADADHADAMHTSRFGYATAVNSPTRRPGGSARAIHAHNVPTKSCAVRPRQDSRGEGNSDSSCGRRQIFPGRSVLHWAE